MESQTVTGKAGTFQIPDLTALYSKPYDATMERWRELGAIDKAHHILDLVGAQRSGINSVLEVGCGTGAVLQQLGTAKFAAKLRGIEIGSSKRAEEHNAGGIEIRGYDGVSIPFGDREFDFVYATHVLEHVSHPRGFLSEMRRVSKRHVFLEVPCELHFRSSIKSLQETINIGHINSYTPESFALTLETSGLKVVKLEVYDQSFELHRFHASMPVAAAKTAIRRLLLQANKRLATRLFTYHCAALCEIAEPLKL